MHLKRTICNFLYLSLIFTSFSSVLANEDTNSKDKNYKLLSKSIQDNYLIKEQINQDCNKSQIIEFFSYSCPACYNIESKVSDFKKSIKDNNNIIFKQMPVVFHENWKNSAKLFFTIQKLELNDKFHNYAFNHVHNSTFPITEYEIRKMIDNYNLQNPNEKIDGKEFVDVFSSNTISRDVKQSMRLFYALNLTGTPVFIINGKFVVLVQDTNKLDSMFQLIKKLAENNKINCTG